MAKVKATAASEGVMREVCSVPVPPAVSRPLSPWLRLAHRRRYPATPPDVVPLQTLLDFELLLVLEGTCWLHVEPAGGAIELGKGSLALVPPGLVHTWGGSADTHIAVHFDLWAKPQIAPLANMLVTEKWVSYQPTRFTPQVRWEGFGDVLTPIVQQPGDTGPWVERMEELLRLSTGRTSAHLSLEEQAGVQRLLLEMLSMWVRMEADDAATNDPTQRVRALLRHVDPTRRNAIGDLAKQAQLSPTAFRSAFRTVTGQTPHRWLEARRIDLAARRLLHTNIPVSVIAGEVGYEDTFHFSRVFRRVTGSPPAGYRKRVRDRPS